MNLVGLAVAGPEAWKRPLTPLDLVMSTEWYERDLTEWAKKTLPEFLTRCMRDPTDPDGRKVVARTPWSDYEISIAEVDIEGEVTLTGRKDAPILDFDMHMGCRLQIEKKQLFGGADGMAMNSQWQGALHIEHFGPGEDKRSPEIHLELKYVEEDAIPEISWYLRNGMGQRLVHHGLHRWHAYAVKKWEGGDVPAVFNPLESPDDTPLYPPFTIPDRRKDEDEIPIEEEEMMRERERKANLSLEEEKEVATKAEKLMAKGFAKDVEKRPKEQVEAQEEPDRSLTKEERQKQREEMRQEAEEAERRKHDKFIMDPSTMQFHREGETLKDADLSKFATYPFKPSMLYGIGGPSTQWLRTESSAIGHPEWWTNGKKSINYIENLVEKGKKRREERERRAKGNPDLVRAMELHEACMGSEFMKAFAKMDEQSVNLRHPDSQRTALHLVCELGKKELTEMILEVKAEVNARDPNGTTALMLAARNSHHEIAKMLLEKGADPVLEDQLGRTAGDQVKILPKDEDYPMKNWKEKLRGDPIPKCPGEKSEELKELMENHEKPKAHGLLLLKAIQQQDIRTAESVVDAGALLDLKDNQGNTALVLLGKVRWKGKESMQARLMQRIVEKGADVNQGNEQGNTCLLYAAFKGNEPLVTALLEQKKSEVDKTNNEGNTALMYAAHGGHDKICTMLLEKYADPNLKNRYGLKAEQMAQKRGYRNVAVLIQAYVLAPKRKGDDEIADQKQRQTDLDYDKWNELERQMKHEQDIEENIRYRENYMATRKPTPKMEDMGPEAFGLPPDTPWPPEDPKTRKGSAFDYRRWDYICEDLEQKYETEERMEYYERNPTYEERHGHKFRVLL